MYKGDGRMKSTFGRYFNKGVKALDAPHIGFVIRETEDKIMLHYLQESQ